MFCDEKIINVYIGQPDNDENGDCFLDCYCDMALHLTPNYRIIFECENFYVSLQTDGVYKTKKVGDIRTIEKDGEWIDSYYHPEEDPEDAPWVEYEFTLFTGEKIIDILAYDKGYIVQFEDFNLSVIPYAENESVFRFIPAAYSRVLGTERLIAKCSCGGTGILDIDFVNDYGIRCSECHKGTGASMCAIDAIDEWNSNINTLFQIGDYPNERFQKCCYGRIDYIAISERNRFYDGSLYCESVIVNIDEKLFQIESCYAGQGKYNFSFSELCDYNKEMWPERIISSNNMPIQFVQQAEKADLSQILRFDVGNTPLLITANPTELEISVDNDNIATYISKMSVD